MTLITHSMADRALSDPVFKTRFPEFSNIPATPEPSSGCRGCGGRRYSGSRGVSFFTILSTLTVPRLVELKNYLCLDKMCVTIRQPNGGMSVTVIDDNGVVK